MLRKSVLTLACTFALAGSVWADTPIGPGTTGTGGTGGNEADGNIRNGEGGAGPKRQDGMRSIKPTRMCARTQAPPHRRATAAPAMQAQGRHPGQVHAGA